MKTVKVRVKREFEGEYSFTLPDDEYEEFVNRADGTEELLVSQSFNRLADDMYDYINNGNTNIISYFSDYEIEADGEIVVPYEN